MHSNLEVRGTNDNVVVFATDEEESYYPVYVAEDKNGNICQLVIQFVDLEIDDNEFED